MKKLILSILLLVALGLCGCGNKQIIDTTWKYDRAIIQLPNGEIVDGKIESWSDYDGEQLQIKINGVTYLVNSNDVALIAMGD